MRSGLFVPVWLIGCAAIFASSSPPASGPAGESEAPQQFHESLRLLQDGRCDESDRIATALADAPQQPMPRAWLVAARARQELRQWTSAVDAYRAFLAASDSPAGREYVRAQVRLCEAATQPAGASLSPGERLSIDERTALAAVAEGTAVEESEHFIVHARNARLAALTAQEAERALARVARFVLGGQEYPHRVAIHIWADRQDYLAHAAGAMQWSGGSFSLTRQEGGIIRRIDLAQLDERKRFSIDTLDRALPHELCHLVTAEFFGDAPCPLFLAEGLSMLAEWDVDNNRLALAGTALAGRGKIPLADLVVVEPGRIAKPQLFYAECYSLAVFLRQHLCDRQFGAMMENLKDGSDLAEAVQRALYSPDREDFLEALAGAWERHAIEQAQYIRALHGERPPDAPLR